jgi:Mce-associated membrane protein
VLLAGWSGWSVWRAVHATPVRYAHAREAVLAAGTHAVRTLNTVDYHHAAQDLAAWRAVAAGGLAKRLADRHISDEHGVRRVRAITTARVLDTGVSELDLHAGTATLLATVRTTVDTRGTKKGKHKGKPHTRHQADHLVVTMTHTGSGWKATGMRVVGGAA